MCRGVEGAKDCKLLVEGLERRALRAERPPDGEAAAGGRLDLREDIDVGLEDGGETAVARLRRTSPGGALPFTERLARKFSSTR